MTDTGYAIRPMSSADESFVFRAWLAGSWECYPGRPITPRGVYLSKWHSVVEAIMRDPSTRIDVAHVDGEPNALLGFVAWGDMTLHWCYVKQAFRGLGIARDLLSRVHSSECSHYSPRLAPAGWRYRPEALERYMGEIGTPAPAPARDGIG